MCHEYLDRSWYCPPSDSDADADETPSVLSDEEVKDVEILTDGGDDS